MNFSLALYYPNAWNRLRGIVLTGRCSDHRNFKNCLNSHPLAFLSPDALLTTGVTQAVILHTSITAQPFRHERGRHLSFRYCSRFLLQADSCHFCRNMKIYVSMAMSSAKHVESQWREGILNNTEQRSVSTEPWPVHTVVGRFSKATWR